MKFEWFLIKWDKSQNLLALCYFGGVLCIKVGFTLFDIGRAFNNLVHFFFFVATILSIKVHFLMSG